MNHKRFEDEIQLMHDAVRDTPMGEEASNLRRGLVLLGIELAEYHEAIMGALKTLEKRIASEPKPAPAITIDVDDFDSEPSEDDELCVEIEQATTKKR